MPSVVPWSTAGWTGPGCEPPEAGALLAEPVSAVTSVAFVAAALAIVIASRGSGPGRGPERAGEDVVLPYAALVGGVGLGSFVQHGPDPSWSDVAHDLPLLATLAFVAADSTAHRTGRPLAWWWWAAPTAALLPLIVAAPRAGDLAQVGVAVIAVTLTLARARAAPHLRPRIGWSVGLLAVGGLIGTLSRWGGPLCVPGSIWQGHAAWHVLAATALVVLTPVIGDRGAMAATARPRRAARPRRESP